MIVGKLHFADCLCFHQTFSMHFVGFPQFPALSKQTGASCLKRIEERFKSKYKVKPNFELCKNLITLIK